MSDETKCPRCGADQRRRLSAVTYFACGSCVENDEPKNYLNESEMCLRRQLTAKDAEIDRLARDLERAKEQIEPMDMAMKKAQRERDEANAASVEMIHDAFLEGWLRCVEDFGSMDAHEAWEGSQHKLSLTANPGQALLDRLAVAEAENVRLRECIEAVARGTLEIIGSRDCWAWADPNSDKVSVDFPTAADAALAARDAAEKENEHEDDD